MRVSEKHRSRLWLEEQGFVVEDCERWVRGANRTQDLLGFADLMALRFNEPPMLVQVTSASNHAARRTKILDEPRAALAAFIGFDLYVHSWKAPSKQKPDWRMRREKLTLLDFRPEVTAVHLPTPRPGATA